jgi:hypothetical protein
LYIIGNENLATYWDKFIIGADFGKLTNILGTPRPLRITLWGFINPINHNQCNNRNNALSKELDIILSQFIHVSTPLRFFN